MYGSVAERSKALVLGTSLFGGVGSNPTAAISFGSHFPDGKIFLFSVYPATQVAQWPSGKASVS